MESRDKREYSYIYNNNNGETVILNRDDNDWDILWTKYGKKKQYRIYGDLYKNYNYPLDSATVKNLRKLGKMKFPEIDWKKFEKLENMKFPEADWKNIEYTLNDAEQQIKLEEKQLKIAEKQLNSIQ